VILLESNPSFDVFIGFAGRAGSGWEAIGQALRPRPHFYWTKVQFTSFCPVFYSPTRISRSVQRAGLKILPQSVIAPDRRRLKKLMAKGSPSYLLEQDQRSCTRDGQNS
jgi:hypothetical protein